MIDYLRIMGVDIEITECPTLSQLGQPGIACLYANEIRIAEGLPELKQLEVLFHEATEIYNDSLELNMKHPQITAMSRCYLQMLLDNPDLIRWLYEQTEEITVQDPEPDTAD